MAENNQFSGVPFAHRLAREKSVPTQCARWTVGIQDAGYRRRLASDMLSDKMGG